MIEENDSTNSNIENNFIVDISIKEEKELLNWTRKFLKRYSKVLKELAQK